jgi:hypothetical protein
MTSYVTPQSRTAHQHKGTSIFDHFCWHATLAAV